MQTGLSPMPLRVHDLAAEARSMWRYEPTIRGPIRTRIMRELTALRFDLEALERKFGRSEPGIEDERALHDCASRLERLRVHWQPA